MMRFQTKRLEVRPFAETDREAMIDLLTDPVVKQTYMLPDFPTREDAAELFERLRALSQGEDRYVAGICLEGACIGILNETEVSGGKIELGYAIVPRFHGRGYGTEILTGAIEYLFACGFTEVVAGAFEENLPSIRVMIKSGMTRLDHQDQIGYRGKTHRCVYYSARKDSAKTMTGVIGMDRKMIGEAEAFLKDTFASSAYLREHPTERDYRLEHSYRVANIAKAIAEAEGFDVTLAVIAGLLHDIAYCEEMPTWEQRKQHGRWGAAMVRPFLERLGLPADAVNDICYGIAIHVDDEADFAWQRTPFCETVGDADNIDRFDAYRIYETLEHLRFSEMSLEEKREKVASTIDRLTQYKEMKLGTATAKALWLQRLDYYIGFYEKLKAQLENSTAVR